MKNSFIAFIFLTFPIYSANSQIYNLQDLIEISSVPLNQMVSELQYDWKLNPSIQERLDPNIINECYPFTFNKDNIKQVLKKCGQQDLKNGNTVWITNFISDDRKLLNRIIESLKYEGYSNTGNTKNNLLFENNQSIITIQKESDEDYKLPTNCFSITVIPNSQKINPSNIKNYPMEFNSISKKRKIIANPQPEYNCKEEGKIVIEITFNKYGNANNATFFRRGSTSFSKCLIDAATEAALNSTIEPDENSTNDINLKFTYNFQVEM